MAAAVAVAVGASLVATAAAFGGECPTNERAVVRGAPIYNGPLVPNLKVTLARARARARTHTVD